MLVTPDILCNAVLRADARITDFRLRQTGPGAIELILPPELAPEAGVAARAGVIAVLAGLGVAPRVTLDTAPLRLDLGRKLRRVECCIPRRAAVP